MKFTGTDSYVASDDLRVAVNAAIALQRPLLIKGEPGTGKTVLAHEVAKAIGAPLIEWHIKSTTKAQQGLYEYDAVSRLRDSQLGDARVKDIQDRIALIEHDTDAEFHFPLSQGQTLFENFVIKMDDSDLSSDLRFGQDLVSWVTTMKPHQRSKVVITYSSRGMDYFYYQIPIQREIKNFNLTLAIDRLPVSLLNSSGSGTVMFRVTAAARMARARGCSENFSPVAARRTTSAS